jgi:hypothetical protein
VLAWRVNGYHRLPTLSNAYRGLRAQSSTSGLNALCILLPVTLPLRATRW